MNSFLSFFFYIHIFNYFWIWIRVYKCTCDGCDDSSLDHRLSGIYFWRKVVTGHLFGRNYNADKRKRNRYIYNILKWWEKNTLLFLFLFNNKTKGGRKEKGREIPRSSAPKNSGTLSCPQHGGVPRARREPAIWDPCVASQGAPALRWTSPWDRPSRCEPTTRDRQPCHIITILVRRASSRQAYARGITHTIVGLAFRMTGKSWRPS